MAKMGSLDKSWKLLKSTVVLDNPWYKVRKDQVQLPNGLIIKDYFVSELKNVAIIFALTKEKEVVFVKQYRHPVQKVHLELPGGVYSARESAKDVARHELLEETGYKAKKLIFLGKILEYPTKDSHEINLFLAKNVIPTKLKNPEITEDIEIVLIPIDKLLQLIKNGQIFVGGSIACIIKSLLNLDII